MPRPGRRPVDQSTIDEVLRLQSLPDGPSDRQIGRQLNLSNATVSRIRHGQVSIERADRLPHIRCENGHWVLSLPCIECRTDPQASSAAARNRRRETDRRLDPRIRYELGDDERQRLEHVRRERAGWSSSERYGGPRSW